MTIALTSGLLRKSDDDLIAAAKSLARRLLRQQRNEYRHWEWDEEKQKMVRRSKSEWRIVSSVPKLDDDGKTTGEFVNPADPIECTVPSDATGRMLDTSQPRRKNVTEDFLVSQIDREWKTLAILEAVGHDDYRFMLSYADSKHMGTLTKPDHRRFRRLKDKVKKALQINQLQTTKINLPKLPARTVVQ
jgi:hypothetical protein